MYRESVRKKKCGYGNFSETDLLFIFKIIRVFPLIWQMEISAKSNFAVSFVMIGCVCVCVVRTYIKVKILVKALQRKFTIRVTNINQENLKLFSPPKILLSQLILILLYFITLLIMPFRILGFFSPNRKSLKPIEADIIFVYGSGGRVE